MSILNEYSEWVLWQGFIGLSQRECPLWSKAYQDAYQFLLRKCGSSNHGGGGNQQSTVNCWSGVDQQSTVNCWSGVDQQSTVNCWSGADQQSTVDLIVDLPLINNQQSTVDCWLLICLWSTVDCWLLIPLQDQQSTVLIVDPPLINSWLLIVDLPLINSWLLIVDPSLINSWLLTVDPPQDQQSTVLIVNRLTFDGRRFFVWESPCRFRSTYLVLTLITVKLYGQLPDIISTILFPGLSGWTIPIPKWSSIWSDVWIFWLDTNLVRIPSILQDIFHEFRSLSNSQNWREIHVW